jgi:hypothetical protein
VGQLLPLLLPVQTAGRGTIRSVSGLPHTLHGGVWADALRINISSIALHSLHLMEKIGMFPLLLAVVHVIRKHKAIPGPNRFCYRVIIIKSLNFKGLGGLGGWGEFFASEWRPAETQRCAALRFVA